MERVNCERYPCHFQDQDCTFCFCPFYPCMNSQTGGHDVDESWCCDDCNLIHQPTVSLVVMDALLNGEAPSEVWKKVKNLL